MPRKIEEPGDFDSLSRAIGAFVREQTKQAIKEQLPELLRGDSRRPPVASAPEALLPQPYLSKEQVAQLTGYSLRTVTRMVARGLLRPCGPRRDRFARAEVDRMMNERKAPVAVPAPANDPDADVTAAVDKLFPVK